MLSPIIWLVLGVTIMILAFIKMMNKPMTDKEIEKWLADDEERIRKYIEKKELERKAKKEEDRWGA